MLLICGVRNPQHKYHYDTDTQRSKVNLKRIVEGDVIITIDCSYLSFLYLQAYFSPVYLVPTIDQVLL